MIGIFQPWHLIVTLVIVVMIFGPGKLPQLGRAIGDGMRELKRAGGDSTPSTASLETPAGVLQPLTAGTVCVSCAATVLHGQPFCGACGTVQVKAARAA